MGNIKSKRYHSTSLTAMITKAVYSIGLSILALAACGLIFLSVSSDRHLFSQGVFVNIEKIIFYGYFCIVISLTVFIPFLTAAKLRKKGKPVLEVMEKIKKQDLDFDIIPSKVKEIDEILESMDDTRLALKEALEGQWRLEQNRKNQISALAHDFKTPMTVLKCNLDLMESDSATDNCIEYIQDAKESLMQMESYLNQLLEVSRAESGYVIHEQKLDLRTMLEEEVSLLDSIAEEREIMLSVEKVDEVWVSADKILLERVINNLISNALDYTPKKGSIKIALTVINNNAVIAVSDSGSGFSKNTLKHGTEQFFMDDSSRGRKNHYGLGLFIADSIVKKHHGIMELTNDEVLGGARVNICIPLLNL